MATGLAAAVEFKISKLVTFRIPIRIPQKISVGSAFMSRDDFFALLWNELGNEGLLGVNEGTMLSEEAAQEGIETELFTIDAGLAPRERDWMAVRAKSDAELYFDSEEGAVRALVKISGFSEHIEMGAIERQEPEDWDAQWKASFQGVSVPPFWEVLPPWVQESANADSAGIILRLNPGAGFGTGTHETTQLCLTLIGEISKRHPLVGARVLDFGSGSGILSIGAALLGAEVNGVEIDPMANENALENLRMNIEPTNRPLKVQFVQKLEELNEEAQQIQFYDLVIANILRPVLIEFAQVLVKLLKPQGVLILSGLMEMDLPEVISKYSELLGRKPEVRKLNEWHALRWDLS